MIATKDCVTPVLRELLRTQPLSPGKVRLAWSAAVGRTIDRVTRVTLDGAGTLLVETEDRHWTREVARASGIIRAQINTLLEGAVTEVVVRTRRPR